MCGIAFHGKFRPKKVIDVRLGQTMSLDYQWYCLRERISLNRGDMYTMTEWR